jgi:hypothetical protein
MLPFLLYGRATGHPLQSLADAITMEEFKRIIDQRSFYPGHHTQKHSPSCRQFLCANDAIARPILSLHIRRLRTQLKLLKTPRLNDQNKAFENADLH